MDPVEGMISDQTPLQTYQTNPPKKKSRKGLLILIAGVVVALGVFWFTRGNSAQTASDTTTTPTQAIEDINITEEPTVEPTSATTTPKPTTAEEKEVSGPKIQVLNGTGEEGVAGKMKTALEGAGFESIETGNADNFDYEKVTIKAKDASMKTAEKLKTQLKDYSFNEDIATLSDDSLFDIVITVGK